MKKNILKFLSTLTILCIGLNLTSCSDDDKGENTGTERLLIGKWQPVSVSGQPVNNSNNLFYPLRDDIIEFSADKTVTYDEGRIYYYSDEPDPNTKSTWSFRVEEFANEQIQVLNIAGKGVLFFREDFFIISVTDTKLVINNGFEYEFKRIK